MTFDQVDNTKKKIQIRRTPQQNRFNSTGPRVNNNGSNYTTSSNQNSFEVELKNLKKTISRLSNFAQYEEDVLKNHKNTLLYIHLINGTSVVGNLKNITKYQIIIETTESLDNKNDSLIYIYKSSVLYYQFKDSVNADKIDL